MELELRFFATFREAVGQKTIHREFDDPVRIYDVLAALEREFEGLGGELLANGGLVPHINVLKNGREVLHLDGVETVVEAGDTVSIFPPVAGG